MAVAGEVSLGMYGSVSSPLFVFFDNTLIVVSKLPAQMSTVLILITMAFL